MKDDQPPRPLSSMAWTGLPPETPCSGANLRFRPPADPSQQLTQLVAVLLFGVCMLLLLGWWVLMSFHSPLAPSPASGQTVASTLSLRRGHPITIYVRPTEAFVTHALAVAAFVVPGGYLAWKALRRRAKG